MEKEKTFTWFDLKLVCYFYGQMSVKLCMCANYYHVRLHIAMNGFILMVTPINTVNTVLIYGCQWIIYLATQVENPSINNKFITLK